MDQSLVTPARPTQPIDISTIEQQKENIQPLVSGRSASQLASLSSHSRSGLGSKLAEEHKLYQARLDAVDTFERTGAWEEGKDGLSSDEVSTMAEDPLDIHHQYARFVLGNYPAGASATSKLVPLLEASTRRFVDDERYKNDPRYLRLWNLYAKNMEAPEDCYRFLFAKGIGEKLASLYEEFALVLEQAGRRKEADKIYTLGINRSVTPLERIKKRHIDFQERMLHAPPLPSPPRPSPPSSTSTSSAARPILAGAGMAPSGAGTVAGKENGGNAFAIFRDTGASKGEHAAGAQWDDLGTVKSRKRENEIEATEWKGETLPMASASKPGAFKLEVFRDSEAPPPTPSRVDPTGDVFTRSVRGPSEAEALRHDPFKNFSSADRNLASIDPLEGLTVLPTSTSAPPKPAASSSKSSTKLSSKKSKSKKDEAKVPAPKPTSERVACDLSAIYPEPGFEYSFEELMMRKRFEKEGDVAASWNGWEWDEAWREETARTGKTTYLFDPATSWPLLHHPVTAEPLFDFVPRPEPPAVEVAPSPLPAATSPPHLASPAPAETEDFFDQSPTRPSTSQQSHSLLSPSPPPAQQPARSLLDQSPTPATRSPARASQDSVAPLVSLSPSPLRQPPAAQPQAEDGSATPPRSPADSPALSPLNPRRPPSPTINTRLAANLLDDLWAKTLDFGKDERAARDSDDSDDSEGDHDSDDEEEDRAAWADIPHSQLNQASQFSQSTSAGASQEDPPFVPFSQTASQLDDSLFQPSQSQFSQLSDVQEQSEESEELVRRVGGAGSTGPIRMDGGDEDDENDENGGIIARPAPMQLFRDSAPVTTPATPGFRPTRAPFGVKALGGGAPAPAPASAFTILRDETVIPPTQEEEEEEHEDSFEDFEAPLEGGEDEQENGGGAYEQRVLGDGFAFGRREKGIPSRYAPFIDAMTPVKEATMEYTGAYTTSSLSASTRSRRESAFPTTAPVEEEDEDDDNDSEDDEDDGDRAFVEYQAEEESDRSSFRTRNGSSSESEPDTEDDEPLVSQQPLPPQQALAEVSLEESSHDWRDSTRKDGQFDEVAGDSSVEPSVNGQDRSFEVSLNGSLPEGYTITGNQSGMTTGMVLADTTTGGNTSDLAKVERTSSPSSSTDAVNPFTDAVLERLLADVSPPILQHPSVSDFTSSIANNLSSLQKTSKRRQSKGGKDRTGVIEDAWELDLEGEVFSVREKLGEGAFGAVYRVAAPQDPDVSFDPDADEDESSLAVKIERPANIWEFHVLDQLHSRLPPRNRRAVVHANRLYAFQDESYLFLDFCDQGSLLDAVNKANESGIAPPTGGASTGLEEVVALFFMIELLRIVEGFHEAGFIHGDLKIDNCLVRLEEVEGGARNWATTYDPSGAGGWASKGVKVIDFGRTINTTLFPPGQQFVCDFETDEFDCVEMREKRSWTYEPDYFGLASIAFNLLFGRYIETKPITDEAGATRYAINQNFKRYHQAELWTKLFDALLNPKSVRSDASLPITSELREIREEMEGWLAKNCDKNGKSLKSLIKKMEIYSMAR